MADIFCKKDSETLFREKKIYLFGDSNMRALYKDLICLIREGTLIDNASLRTKLESSYLNDRLIKKSHLHSGRDYIEERKYHMDDIYLEYKFITRCWCDVMEKFTNNCSSNILKPDVIIINSCLWDISRWGPNGVNEYKDNMLKLLKKFRKVLPPQCIVIWTTTLPVASKCKAAFLVEQVDFLKHSLHFDVMEANVLAKDLVITHGFDILDVHHYLRMQTLLRQYDGIHWKPTAIRLISNLVLTHLALSWKCDLPGRVFNSILNRCIHMNDLPITRPLISSICKPEQKLLDSLYPPKIASNVRSVVRHANKIKKPYQRNNDYDQNACVFNYRSYYGTVTTSNNQYYDDYSSDNFNDQDSAYKFAYCDYHQYDYNGPIRRNRNRRY